MAGASADSVIDRSEVETFQRDGVVIIRGLFKDWVDSLCAGVEHNMQQPGEFGKTTPKKGRADTFLVTTAIGSVFLSTTTFFSARLPPVSLRSC